MQPINTFAKRLKTLLRDGLEVIYLRLDKANLRTVRNIRQIPRFSKRIGGRKSYVEWGHAIGVFETLIKLNIASDSNPFILDIGCGHGFLAIASEPLLHAGGTYTGIDVNKDAIEYCQRVFKHNNYQFLHLNLHNAMYSDHQPDVQVSWAVQDGVVDLVTALSVWTHLLEKDALYYFKEIDRVLKPGGKAIITFFLLDEYYEKTLSANDKENPYNATKPGSWLFTESLLETGEWYYPAWVTTPENAIGVTPKGLDILLQNTDLQTKTIHPGNWKNIPGIYFQDIVILEKKS